VRLSVAATPDIRTLVEQLDVERMARRTFEMVQIPSPSGEERPMAERFAEYLREAGLGVTFDAEFPESPSVIGRIGGARMKTLQLAGHLDTVPNLQAQAPERRDDVIYGRGACDMKAGLAVIAEVAGVLNSAEVRLDGNLLVTAYGQHEASVGDRELHAPLRSLLRRGIKGDACIIPEGPHDELAISGKGAVIYTIRFTRPGSPVHEILSGDSPPPNPLMAAHRFVSLLAERAHTWPYVDDLVGPESFFVGSLHGGDLYNRIPTSAEVTGTRRYPVPRTYEEARDELHELASRAAAELGVKADVKVDKSGQPFRLRPDEPIVAALQQAYRSTTGRELTLSGMRYAGDVSQFVNTGAVPAVYHGTDQTSAHSDFESVPIAAIRRCAEVLLSACVDYLAVL
jgi:acetylornithine deacetylase/succinyl-diaminopimelate desuccinylase-like protein